MSANFVARQLEYRMTDGWGAGDASTQEHFRPLETFGVRLAEILDDVVGMGFTAIDLWGAHLHPDWASDEHVAHATRALSERGLAVASLAGWFGSTREQFEASCRLAVRVGATILGGATSLLTRDRSFVVDRLREHGLRLAVENHPERSPAEMLALIGDGDGGVIGTTVDTGWYGTHGYDAARAIDELGPHVLHVHLKDVLEAGRHRCCAYGRGVVPIRRCVDALLRIGYAGAVSVEHEPEDYDPSAEIRENLALLRGWLAEPLAARS